MPRKHSIHITPGILLMLWLLTGAVVAVADDDPDSTPDAEQSPILPEPGEDIDDLMQDRDDNDDASVASDEYPAVPGCAPLEGDREALPLADRAHRAISETLCDPAQQLDDALADPNDSVPENGDDAEPQQLAGPPETGTAVLRMSIQTDIRRHEAPEPGAGLNASVRLPQMYQRLTLFAQRQADNMVDMEAQEEEESGLVWVARPALFLLSRTDVGLSGYAPFVRLSLPFGQSFDSGPSWRVRPETYWRWDDGAGVGSEQRLTYPHDSDNQWVFNQRIETNEAIQADDDGWTWSQRLTYSHLIQERFTLTARIRSDGVTRPDWQTERVQSDLRLRRSFWRPWFFGEVEPYTLWERDTGFEATPGIILRLEVQFGDYDY